MGSSEQLPILFERNSGLTVISMHFIMIVVAVGSILVLLFMMFLMLLMGLVLFIVKDWFFLF